MGCADPPSKGVWVRRVPELSKNENGKFVSSDAPVPGKCAFLPLENENPNAFPVAPTEASSADRIFFKPPG